MRKIARLAVSSALLGASALTATAVGAANASAAPSPASLCPDANIAMFGPNVCVFTPSMPQAAIQNDVNANRYQIGGGWFINPIMLFKLEYVNQKYLDFPTTDIRYGGQFKGFMISGAVGF